MKKVKPEIQKKVKELLSQMTVEEKVGQMLQTSHNAGGMTKEAFEEWKKQGLGSYLHVLGEEAQEFRDYAKQTRLKIPPIFGIDAIHGHSLLNGATIFPSQLGMACSWNEDLIYKMGKVTATEVAADGLDWVFSPVLCLGRDLRWGRVDETFGEDHYLTGRLGKAIISGYQEDGLIIACAKHYLGYGEATGGRDSYDTEVSMRKVREVFLKPFADAVDVDCYSMMTAYGSIDATPLTAHKKLLRTVLKDELGFEGFVVTDWENFRSLYNGQYVAKDIDEACKIGIEAGNDMSMNSPEFFDATVKLVKEGKIPMKYIDDAVSRILRVKFELDLFNENKQLPDRKLIGCKEHADVNLAVTLESMVLLENKDNALPLSKSLKKIAVIGPNADDMRAQFGDWTFFSHPTPKNYHVDVLNTHYSMLDGIREVFKDSEIVYEKGCSITDDKSDNIKKAVKVAKKADVIILCIGDNLSQNGEGKDRADLNISGKQLELLKALKKTGKKVIAVLVNGKPLILNEVKELADAVVETFNSGDLGGLALAKLLCGDANFTGKLPITFPRHVAQIPCYYNQYEYWHGGKYMDVEKGYLYNFGYGLSYSSFEYSNLKLSKNDVAKTSKLKVSVDVKNVSNVDGKEIVQMYFNDVASSILTPIKQLIDFKKVEIKAGETKTVDFDLAVKDLGFYNMDEKYVVESGEFKIMVGKSSEDYLTAVLNVK